MANLNETRKGPGWRARRREMPAHHREIKTKLLEALLPDVPFDGWTEKGMRIAARRAGLDESLVDLVFPGGVLDCIRFFIEEGDRKMVERLAERGLGNMKIRDRITLAVRTRLDVDAPHEEAARRAAAVLALPTSGLAGARALYGTVDAIWRAVGDSSTDFNFYTKRATLAAVYSSTFLVWAADESPEKVSTWRFLDRRIENVMSFEKAKAEVGARTAGLPNAAELLGRLRYGRATPPSSSGSSSS